MWYIKKASALNQKSGDINPRSLIQVSLTRKVKFSTTGPKKTARKFFVDGTNPKPNETVKIAMPIAIKIAGKPILFNYKKKIILFI